MSYAKVIHRQLQYSESGYGAFGADALPNPPPEATGEACWLRASTAPRYVGIRVGFAYQGPRCEQPTNALLSVYRWDAALTTWQPVLIGAVLYLDETMAVALPTLPTVESVTVAVVVAPQDPQGLPGVYEVGIAWEPLQDGTPSEFKALTAKAVPFGTVEPVAVATPCRSVLIQAPTGNAGTVYLGNDMDAAALIANGGMLPPGASITIDLDDAAKVFCTGSVPGLALRVVAT